MSMINAAGMYSSFSKSTYLKVVPSGAGSVGVKSIILDFRLEVDFRLTSLTNEVILGSSVNTHILLYYNGGNIRSFCNSSAAAVPIALQVNTWYKCVLVRIGNNYTFTITNDDGELIGSGTAFGSSDSHRMEYLAKYHTGYFTCDYKYLAIGTVAAPTQHEWKPQDSGNTWVDTGTIGGWNIILSGAPLPSWESL